MKSETHKLFKHFPIQSATNISTGNVPTPYSIYDGFGLFIGGAADLDVVKHILENEDVYPVETSDGKALMGIWICNFTEASLNPHHELQFSFFVSRQKISPIQHHAYDTLIFLLAGGDVNMLCHGLWNDTPTVVAYNRELLGLNVLRSDGEIQHTRKRVDFAVEDAGTGIPLIAGSVKNTSSLPATISFMFKLDFQQRLALVRQPWINMEVINPKGVKFSSNMPARAFVKNDVNVLRLFDATDVIEIEHPMYKSLNFIPEVVQSMDGIKMVYLQPGM